MIDHSLERFRDAPPAALTAGLCKLIADIRRVLAASPELPPHAQVAAIRELVDEQAPPPEPDGGTGPGWFRAWGCQP